MMELKDFENFLEFNRKQIAILKEKENGKYKDDFWKNIDEDDLYDSLYVQAEKFEYETNENAEYRQRRLLHIANYAFFLYEKLKGE